MSLYLDSAYVAKLYLDEPDAAKVRKLVEGDRDLCSSAWCAAEMACIFHRQVRETGMAPQLVRRLENFFSADVQDGLFTLLPLSESLLRKVQLAMQELPPDVFLRAGDAVHLVSAREAGFTEIWSNDRRLLAAARHFGLKGRSV